MYILFELLEFYLPSGFLNYRKEFLPLDDNNKLSSALLTNYRILKSRKFV